MLFTLLNVFYETFNMGSKHLQSILLSSPGLRQHYLGLVLIPTVTTGLPTTVDLFYDDEVDLLDFSNVWYLNTFKNLITCAPLVILNFIYYVSPYSTNRGTLVPEKKRVVHRGYKFSVIKRVLSTSHL